MLHNNTEQFLAAIRGVQVPMTFAKALCLESDLLTLVSELTTFTTKHFQQVDGFTPLVVLLKHFLKFLLDLF